MDRKEFEHFVTALVTGIMDMFLRRYFCFCSGASRHPVLGIKLKWPLCYIQCIMRYYVGIAEAQDIAMCIDSLFNDSSTVGDGMVWEQSVKIAILLRFVLAATKGFGIPFNLCADCEVRGADIRMVPLGEGIKTVQQARHFIFNYAKHLSRTTLVLFYPIEASLAQFDGFCALFGNSNLLKVCGYQCKDNAKGSSGKVSDWITQGGHLLRSKAPRSCKIDGPNLNGWTYYNATDTDDFLGWSLQIMRSK